jgi:hypothetical protein
MDANESSRNAGVKYDYRIDRLDVDDSFSLITEINKFTGAQYIIEFENKKPFRYWDLNFLKKDFKDSPIFNREQEDVDSFERTKKWTRTNYPELLV